MLLFCPSISWAGVQILDRHWLDNMPLVLDPEKYYGGMPHEQRESKYRKWLAPSLKIKVSGASGSAGLGRS